MSFYTWDAFKFDLSICEEKLCYQSSIISCEESMVFIVYGVYAGKMENEEKFEIFDKRKRIDRKWEIIR